MADINTVALVGRLTRDPELRHTTGGTAATTLRIAVNGRKRGDGDTWVDDPNFFDVQLYGRLAEVAAEHLVKGRQVGVTGRLNWRDWTAQDGSKRQNVEVVANDLQFLAPAANGGNSQPVSDPVPADDDLPF